MHRNEMRVCSVADAALDVLAMGHDIKKYIDTRDPALVKEVPDKKITWFNLRRVPTSIYQRYVITASSDSERRQRAFRVGVQSIENFQTMDGQTFSAPWSPTGKVQTGVGEQTMFNDDELDLVAPIFVEEIGSVVDTFSLLVPGSAALFPPPRLLLSVLGSRLSRHVADLRESVNRSNEQAKEQDLEQTIADVADAAGAVAAKAKGGSGGTKSRTRKGSAGTSRRSRTKS